MTPARRQRKRPASPQADQPKKKKAEHPLQSNSDNDNDIKVVKPKKESGKSKGKASSKSEAPADGEANGNFQQQKKAAGNDATAGSAQYAKIDRLIVPVDETCLFDGHVYVDGSTGIIYDASLNQTVASANNNKFYRIQLLTNGRGRYQTWTRWGRVGENGQSALLGDGSFDDALMHYEKKFKAKAGLAWDDRGGKPKSGKYVFIERNYEPESSGEEEEEEEEKEGEGEEEDGGEYLQASKGERSRSRSASPSKSSLPPPVKSLMELIFNQKYIEGTMADMNYDAAKLPLGKLSKATITRGYQALKDLAALFNDMTLAQSEYGDTYANVVETLSNQYYSYIPHAFGRNRPPVIYEHERLKKEVELLQSLTDLKDSDSILKSAKARGAVHPLDVRYNGLGMREMSAVDKHTAEFQNISDYLINTKGFTHSHSYEVIDIFRIERNGESERFEQFTKTSNSRRLLWHGSRATNFGGILSQGLRIAPPEAPVSGWMFGKGVYLADMSSKSANYCYAGSSGGHAILLLCEAELGTPLYELTQASYTAGEEANEQGSLSTLGAGQTGPLAWKDAACVHPSLAGVKMPDTTIPVGQTGYPGASLQYNEYICYDVSQIRLRYLLRVKM